MGTYLSSQPIMQAKLLDRRPATRRLCPPPPLIAAVMMEGSLIAAVMVEGSHRIPRLVVFLVELAAAAVETVPT